MTTEKEKTDHVSAQDQTEGCAPDEDSQLSGSEAIQAPRDIFFKRGARQALVCILLVAVLLLLSAYGLNRLEAPEAEPDAAADTTRQKLKRVLEEVPKETVEEAPDALPEEEDPSLEEQDEPEPSDQGETISVSSGDYSQEALDQVVQEVLDAIISDNMTKREQARAVWDYTRTHVMYTGTSDKSDWRRGAYAGLTTRRGDCFTYYAVSRALLTALGIDNLEVQRVGGPTSHYWNLVNCGDGWYHFDATPRSSKMPYFVSFMFTDQQAADYTARAGRNYYTFDGSLYPARAGGSATTSTPEKTPAEQAPSVSTEVTETTEPEEPVSEVTPDEGISSESGTPAEGEVSPDETVEEENAPPEEGDIWVTLEPENPENEAGIDGAQERPE